MVTPRATSQRRLLAAMASLTLGLAVGGACQAQRLHYGDADVYHGPYLSWQGKRLPTKGAAPTSQGQPRRFQPQHAVAAWNQEGDSAAPQDDYARPQSQTQGQQRTAAVAPAPSPTNQTGGSGARFYSLHREFGLTPDPIPKTSGHMVLIGPPSRAPNLAADEDSARPRARASNASRRCRRRAAARPTSRHVGSCKT